MYWCFRREVEISSGVNQNSEELFEEQNNQSLSLSLGGEVPPVPSPLFFATIFPNLREIREDR
jgi:hypothetical protein